MPTTFDVTIDCAVSSDDEITIFEDGPNGLTTHTFSPDAGEHTYDMLAAADFEPQPNTEYWYDLARFVPSGIETSPVIYSVTFDLAWEEETEPEPDPDPGEPDPIEGVDPVTTQPYEVFGEIEQINLYDDALPEAERSKARYEVYGEDYYMRLLDPSQSPLQIQENGTAYGVELGEEFGGSTPPSTFDVKPNGAIFLRSLTDDVKGDLGNDRTPEGLCYMDGHLYSGEREEPATIHEWAVSGTGDSTTITPTGETMAVPGGHINAIFEVDGELWVSSSTTRELYIVDFDAKDIVDTITFAGPVANGSPRDIIVDGSDGRLKMIFPIFRGESAYVIDAADARADGTTDGHVEQELRTGFWFNVQTMCWRGNDCYTVTHENIIKHRLPELGEIRDNYPLLSTAVEWVRPLRSATRAEQLVYAEDRGEFFLLTREDNGWIYRAFEISDAGWHTMGDFADVCDFVEAPSGTPFDEATVLDFNRGTSGHIESIRFNYHNPTRGRVEVWMYDDLSNDKRLNLGVDDGAGSSVNAGVMINKDWGDEHYGMYDGDVHDTYVDRVEGWIKFAFEFREGSVQFFISKDGGDSWIHVRDANVNDSIRGIRLQHYSGSVLVGPWSCRLWRE